MELEKVLEGVSSKIFGLDPKREIKMLTYHHKKVKMDYIYFAIKGTNYDGEEVSAEMWKKGAVVVSEKELAFPHILVPSIRKAMSQMAVNFHQNPSEKMKVIAITGTNGKTSTGFFLKGILDKLGVKTGIIGTVKSFFGDKDYKTTLTTPDPLELQEILFDMEKRGAEVVIMEASAHALHFDKLAGMKIFTGIFTNLTEDHLDFFKTMENYKKAKIKLFEMSSFAVVNTDDQMGMELTAKVPLLSFSCEQNADIVFCGREKTLLTYKVLADEFSFDSKIFGNFNYVNLGLALGAAHILGFEKTSLLGAISSLSPVKGRMERVKTPYGMVFVDFAHTPDGLEKVLTEGRALTKGKLIAVFGCGGDRDRQKRKIMGEISEKFASLTIITSDNPRSEDPFEVAQEIKSGNANAKIILGRHLAITYALNKMEENDTLMILGKGHETTQEIKGQKFHFNDVEEVENYFRQPLSGVFPRTKL